MVRHRRVFLKKEIVLVSSGACVLLFFCLLFSGHSRPSPRYRRRRLSLGHTSVEQYSFIYIFTVMGSPVCLSLLNPYSGIVTICAIRPACFFSVARC